MNKKAIISIMAALTLSGYPMPGSAHTIVDHHPEMEKQAKEVMEQMESYMKDKYQVSLWQHPKTSKKQSKPMAKPKSMNRQGMKQRCIRKTIPKAYMKNKKEPDISDSSLKSFFLLQKQRKHLITEASII